MTQEEIKSKMEDGCKKVQPIVLEITGLVMNAYQEGFKNCWELLTGQKFK